MNTRNITSQLKKVPLSFKVRSINDLVSPGPSARSIRSAEEKKANRIKGKLRLKLC